MTLVSAGSAEAASVAMVLAVPAVPAVRLTKAYLIFALAAVSFQLTITKSEAALGLPEEPKPTTPETSSPAVDNVKPKPEATVTAVVYNKDPLFTLTALR